MSNQSRVEGFAAALQHLEQSGEVAGLVSWFAPGARPPITYAGVSLLTFGDDDQVARFATYFDTAAFLHPEEI